jgi:acyl-homoserine lactone acylase PvdQ
MQADTPDPLAPEIIPYPASLSFDDPAVFGARDLLAAWDGRTEPASAAAALYSYFWLCLVEVLFRDQVPRALWTAETALENNSRPINTVSALLDQPDNPLWDRVSTHGARETRDDILAADLAKAVDEGTRARGRDIRRWAAGSTR